jgi:hypothetical protein
MKIDPGVRIPKIRRKGHFCERLEAIAGLFNRTIVCYTCASN